MSELRERMIADMTAASCSTCCPRACTKSATTVCGIRRPIGLGDEQRLTQVLLNLVGNAIKFTDTGEVRVTARAINGHFAVSVTDTGPGIPEQERTRIFEQLAWKAEQRKRRGVPWSRQRAFDRARREY
jgi:signal transduction histidine kinase